MSMRGEIISREYQHMVIVQDKDGQEYSCYIDDVNNFNKKDGLSKNQKARCTNLNAVLGDSW